MILIVSVMNVIIKVSKKDKSIDIGNEINKI